MKYKINKSAGFRDIEVEYRRTSSNLFIIVGYKRNRSNQEAFHEVYLSDRIWLLSETPKSDYILDIGFFPDNSFEKKALKGYRHTMECNDMQTSFFAMPSITDKDVLTNKKAIQIAGKKLSFEDAMEKTNKRFGKMFKKLAE